MDQKAFRLWKDEAFSGWLEKWAVIYSADSPSHAFLQNVHDTFYLFNVVENDYINQDLAVTFMQFIERN